MQDQMMPEGDAQVRWVSFGRNGLSHTFSGDLTTCGLKVPSTAIRSNRLVAQCPACEQRNPERAELIERVLDYMIQSPVFKVRTEDRIAGSRQVSAWEFDGAEPMLGNLPNKDELYWGADTSAKAWPFDIRLLGPDNENNEWRLYRYRSLSQRETRGRTSLALPYPVEMVSANPERGEALFLWMGRAGAGKWVPILKNDRRNATAQGPDAELSATMRYVLGYAEKKRSEWRVYLGLPERPGIELPTSPIGAREVFALRDIPEGQQRRAALRHWVSEHWRMNAFDPAEEVKVREHLRGVREFVWNGLRCRISPSELDIERQEDSRDNRVADRVHGMDRRSVVSSLT